MSVVRRHTITVIRAAESEDRRGNLTRDWANATRAASKGWGIDAGNTTEDGDGRDGIAAEYTIRGPFTADVVASDRVELFGVEFNIEGAVLRQPGPSPVTSHTIVRLKRVDG